MNMIMNTDCELVKSQNRIFYTARINAAQTADTKLFMSFLFLKGPRPVVRAREQTTFPNPSVMVG